MDGAHEERQAGALGFITILERYKRYLYRAITWRVIATAITMGSLWWATGRFEFAVAIGLAEAVIKIFFYILHEIVWKKWGAEKHE